MLSVLCLHLVLLPFMAGHAITTSNTTGAHTGKAGCLGNKGVSLRIGGIVDRGSRMGREQEVAMKMAVEEVIEDCLNHYKLQLHLVDSHGSSSRAISGVMKLIDSVQVGSLIGRLHFPQAAMITDIDEKSTQIPFVLLNPTALTPPLVQLQSQNLIQISDDITVHAQCIAAIVGYFRWSKVTVIYEQDGAFALNFGTITILSDALKSVDAAIEQYKVFPTPTSSGWDPAIAIEKDLSELRSKPNRIFIIVQCSLELATHIFLKAKQMGMLRRGYVWIISDEIASFIQSLNSSVIESMQGVIGYKTFFNDTSNSFKAFRHKFQQRYGAIYPEEEDVSPSIFALRAYDIIQAIFNASKNPEAEIVSSALLQNFLSSNFRGLSGNVSFHSGQLSVPPVFQVINIIGKSYNELAYWSIAAGFSKEPPGGDNSIEKQCGSCKPSNIELEPVYWPGGQQTVPPGWDLGGRIEALRIGVPAAGAFHHFINVSHDSELNRTVVSGFSVDVFKAALKYLPYHLPYVFVPHYGTYDEMVRQIYVNNFDGAVGDTNILANRWQWADFTQPYVKSGLALVVPVKPDTKKETWMFMEVFELKMWILIPSMSLFIGCVVWLTEHGDNPEFSEGPITQQIGTMLWFSFQVLFFVQKESLRSNLSKLVMAPWLFLILMLTANFTAALTSKLTVAQLQLSADLETLRRENAIIGCNRWSFTCNYLVDVFQIKRKNIREMRSFDDYPKAFQRGDIKAAVFVTEHANVFLAKYCRGFTLARPTFTFGGFGFAFQKGSPLAADMSQAIIRAIESGEVGNMENDLLSHYNCSSADTTNDDTSGLGFRPFSGLFYISGGIATTVLLMTVIPRMKRMLSFMTELFRKRFCNETCPENETSEGSNQSPTP